MHFLVFESVWLDRWSHCKLGSYASRLRKCLSWKSPLRSRLASLMLAFPSPAWKPCDSSSKYSRKPGNFRREKVLLSSFSVCTGGSPLLFLGGSVVWSLERRTHDQKRSKSLYSSHGGLTGYLRSLESLGFSPEVTVLGKLRKSPSIFVHKSVGRCI